MNGDAEDQLCSVLVNAEGQYSLWIHGAEVPEGWSIALSGQSKDQCVQYIEKNWIDMRPKSLAAKMDPIVSN